MDEVSEEKSCLRNLVLVVHLSDKQIDFLVDAMRKSESEWTWTLCTWVKETGSARSQGPRMRYDSEHWMCCWRTTFNPKFVYDTNEDDER